MRNIIGLVLAIMPIMVDAQSKRIVITDEDRMRGDQLEQQRLQRQPTPEQLRAWQQYRQQREQQAQREQQRQRVEEARQRTRETAEKNERIRRQMEINARAQRCSGYVRAPGGRPAIQGC